MYREYYVDHPGEFQINFGLDGHKYYLSYLRRFTVRTSSRKTWTLDRTCRFGSMVWGSDQSIVPNFGDAISGNHLRPRSGISPSAAVNNGTELPEEKNDSHELRPIRPMDYSVYYFSLVLAWKLPHLVLSPYLSKKFFWSSSSVSESTCSVRRQAAEWTASSLDLPQNLCIARSIVWGSLHHGSGKNF